MKSPDTLTISETIKLLVRLRAVKAEYPPDLLSARRAGFLKQVSAAGLNTNGSQPSAQTQGGSAHLVEKILQYALVGVVAVMSVVATYVYREDVREFFSPDQNNVQIVETPLLPSFGDLSPLPSASPTPTMTMTPTPTEASIYILPILSTPNSNSKPISTPTSTNSNSGLHLGQTKTPKP